MHLVSCISCLPQLLKKGRQRRSTGSGGTCLQPQVAHLEGVDCSGLVRAIEQAKTIAELKRKGFEVLEAGFANCVCGVEKQGHQLIVKKYTDLIFLRVDPKAVGAVDVHAGCMGIGPRVFFSGLKGLVEERLPGRTLEEEDMNGGSYRLLEEVAQVMAKLHQLSVPHACAGEPMLWRTIELMLVAAEKAPELLPSGVPSIARIRREAEDARCALVQVGAKIVLCHNDCKPSNVIYADDREEKRVMLIDFELGGPNYRGFDLMKLFRTNLESGTSEAHLKHFLSAYRKQLSRPAVESSESAEEEEEAELLVETRCFEPLTWLEALAFFLTMPSFKPAETPRWHALAVDRWEKYLQTKHWLIPK